MTNPLNRSTTKLPAIALAAVASVVFWSLKPIFISMIGDRGDYAEVYVASGTIAVAVSIIASCICWKYTRALLRSGPHLYKAIGWASISGLFLAMWYYGFYRALYGAAKADATIIAFVWPLIATVAIRFITPDTAAKLKPNQWLLVIASFVGAVAIGIANYGVGQAGGGSPEIVWAFVAALGSGLYLPFAFKATTQIEQAIPSKPFATFYSISIANAVALAAVLLSLKAADHPLRFYAFDTQVLFICALIGIGTYLIAEVTWTWAFQEYRSLTLSSLPYFSPAVSVILLHIFFDEPVRPIAIVGLVLILFSNLTLHANQKSTNALSLTLIATVYVALASQILPLDGLGAIPEMAAALTGLFAILAGFILSRASERRTQEVDARAVLVRKLITADPTADHALADQLLCDLLEFEFSETREEKERYLAKIRAALSDERITDEDRRNEAKDALSTWHAMHSDRLSTGETAALWLTGIGSVIFVLLLRDASPFGAAGSIIFAAGAFLAIFTIRDYDQNNLHGFRNQVRRLQQGFAEIGRPYYVPAEVVRSGYISPTTFAADDRVRYGRTSGEDTPVTIPKRRVFNSVYLGTAALVILSVLLLPVSSLTSDGSTATAAPRPGEEAAAVDDEKQGSIVIADPGWKAATVTAEIIRLALEEKGISASVEPVDQTDLSADLIAEDPTFHVHPDLWVENQPLALQEAVESDQLRLNAEPYTASQGIYVLDNDETKKAVTSLDALSDPAAAKLFDTDGDGDGEFWLGARGWVSTENLKDWVDSEGFSNVEHEEYSETIFKAKLEQLAPSDQPAIFYDYVPDGLHEKYDLRRLGDVPGEESSDEVTVHVARTAEVREISTTADRILQNFSFSAEDMNSFIAQSDEGTDPEVIAQKWVESNQDVINQWADSAAD
ncbi:MAG: glycine betaine ABC transporter substrate-binding protein [Brevibacterium yomogidense]